MHDTSKSKITIKNISNRHTCRLYLIVDSHAVKINYNSRYHTLNNMIVQQHVMTTIHCYSICYLCLVFYHYGDYLYISTSLTTSLSPCLSLRPSLSLSLSIPLPETLFLRPLLSLSSLSVPLLSLSLSLSLSLPLTLPLSLPLFFSLTLPLYLYP